MAIERINGGSSPAIIRELWIADTPEELTQLGEQMVSRYHPCGYGTRFTVPAKCESVSGLQRYTGKYFSNFSRYTSCD